MEIKSWSEFFTQKTDIVNESVDSNFYDKFWIDQLKGDFDASEVIVDNSENIKPLYGGGNYQQVGYKVILNENEDKIDYFILEGMMLNGCFMTQGILLSHKGMLSLHGSLNITFNHKQNFKDNMNDVVLELKNKISTYLKR